MINSYILSSIVTYRICFNEIEIYSVLTINIIIISLKEEKLITDEEYSPIILITFLLN